MKLDQRGSISARAARAGTSVTELPVGNHTFLQAQRRMGDSANAAAADAAAGATPGINAAADPLAAAALSLINSSYVDDRPCTCAQRHPPATTKHGQDAGAEAGARHPRTFKGTPLLSLLQHQGMYAHPHPHQHQHHPYLPLYQAWSPQHDAMLELVHAPTLPHQQQQQQQQGLQRTHATSTGAGLAHAPPQPQPLPPGLQHSWLEHPPRKFSATSDGSAAPRSPANVAAGHGQTVRIECRSMPPPRRRAAAGKAPKGRGMTSAAAAAAAAAVGDAGGCTARQRRPQETGRPRTRRDEIPGASLHPLCACVPCLRETAPGARGRWCVCLCGGAGACVRDRTRQVVARAHHAHVGPEPTGAVHGCCAVHGYSHGCSHRQTATLMTCAHDRAFGVWRGTLPNVVVAGLRRPVQHVRTAQCLLPAGPDPVPRHCAHGHGALLAPPCEKAF